MHKSVKHVVSNKILSVIGQMIAGEVASGDNIELKLKMVTKDTPEVIEHRESDPELAALNKKNADGNVLVGCMVAASGNPINLAFMITQFLTSHPEIGAGVRFFMSLDIDPEGAGEKDKDEDTNIDKYIDDLMKNL